MVRTGHHNGVPLYADTTLEPYSIVYVPIGRGLMQPYERVRRGELAGTAGSRTPSFPARTSSEPRDLPAAAVPPTSLPQPVGAISASAGEPGAVGTAGRSSAPVAVGTGGVVPRSPQNQPPLTTLRRAESNDGVWLRFMVGKWVRARDPRCRSGPPTSSTWASTPGFRCCTTGAAGGDDLPADHGGSCCSVQAEGVVKKVECKMQMQMQNANAKCEMQKITPARD